MCYNFVLINISLIPKGGIGFPWHLAGGETAIGSLPPTSAHSGPCALNSQINSKRMALCLMCAPGSHLYKTVLTNLSILHLHKSSPWAFRVVLRVECEYVCYTPGTSFPWMLCRCLILHSLNQGNMPLLMLVPPPGMTFTNVPTSWNPSKSLSVFHMPNFSEILYSFPYVDFFQP